MEEVQDVMVMRGDPDISNEVKHIDYDNLKQSLSSPTASPPLPSIPLLNVLSLSLSFDTIASKDTQNLEQHLTSNSITSPLPISFHYARENSKTPHVLFISSPTPDSPRLIELSALDENCKLAQKWVTIHSPPPLTKSGSKFKNAKSQAALRAKERGAKIQVPLVGGGGLLDALVILGNAPGSGIKLRGELKIEDDATLFKIDLKVYLDPTLFFPLPFSRAKQLLLNRLFPHPPSSTSNQGEATIDYFYSCLNRAPRTIQGLPLSSTPIAIEETEEERTTRLRREAKGKGRAIEPGNGGGGDNEGEEDLLIRPRGLKVELFPFQSRSVRWMVAREGARLRKPTEEEENEMDETEEREKKEKSERRKKAAAAQEAKKVKAKGKGKGKAKKQDDGSESSASEEDEQDEEHQRLVIEKLSTEELARIKRGPLWEEVELNVIDEDGDEKKTGIWLNRITGQLSQTDPLSRPSTSDQTEEDKIKEEDEEEEQEDRMDLDEDGEKQPLEGAQVVGGIEGHGLLADEVGTGKTVTTISLILLHTDRERRRLPSYFNAQTDASVQPTGLSLIVCPTAIAGQWMQELARLAPSLRVLRYEAAKNLKPHFTPAYVAKNYDVVLTTFDVLRKEVTIARKPHVRALRNQAKREIRYRRSLLIEVDWLRVVADETQMVGDSFGPTSETLSLIPRQYSWAVTSTPLRDKIEDIRPLLTYLRVEPIASNKGGLARLLEEPECFKRLFNEIGERTLKSQIENELVLPKQTRFLVPLDFTAVEKYYYDTRYNEMLEALGLNHNGEPREQIDRLTGEPREWTPDKAEMNKWLNMLRALAAHPQIGTAGRQALGHVLKTVEEVYSTMREQALSEIQSDQKAILAVKVKRGQYLMWDKDVEDRFEPALRLFENVLSEVEPIIGEVVREIHEAWKERRKSRSSSSASPVNSDVAGALQVGFANDEGQDEEILSVQERAFARSLSSLRNRLRDLLFVKHSALFFTGHAHFNLKQEDEETKAYSKAEQLRQTLLQPYENHVEKAQSTLLAFLEARDEDHVLEVTDLELPFNDEGHGIVALTVYEDIEITSDILNGYAELIYQYRQMIIDMMLKTVSIAGENATGEEYEERAVLQEKLEVYIEAYTVLLGEWSWGINGTRSTMADQFKAEQTGLFFTEEAMIPRPAEPAPPPRQRKGKKRNAKKAQLDSEDEEEGDDSSDVEVEEDEEEETGSKKKRKRKPPGEKTRHQQKRTTNIKANSINDFRPPTLETGHTPADILRYELLVERIEAMGEDREFSEITPLRHLIKKLKDASELSPRDAEIALLNAERSRIGKALGPLEAVSDRLKAELHAFNQAFNARLLYFKNLQGISDSVKDPDMDSSKWRGLLVELEDLRLQEIDLVTELEARKKRKRYLDNLNTPDEEQETCPICAEHYNDGVLLGCVHLICRNCFKNWHARSRTCPLCKAPVADRSWTNVKYHRKGKKTAARMVEQEKDVEVPEKDDNFEPLQELGEFELPTPELAQLSQEEIDEISSIETAAPLSTKSDFIVKHVKLLRRRDPEAKVVIFSAWQDALSLLAESFNRNGLEFVRLEGSAARGKREGVVKKFTEDPSIAAFFLHTRSQSAGLTLTCARYMMLVEPLLAPQLEVQATARIWRIGQTKETIVFNYAIADSVDFRVAELRARAGTSLFLANDESTAGRVSMLGQTKDLASNPRSRTKETNEVLDDEDEMARCLLSSEHYAELQRSLLPFRLRNNPGAPALPEGNGEDMNGHHEMEAPGIAAAGRAVAREEEEGEA